MMKPMTELEVYSRRFEAALLTVDRLEVMRLAGKFRDVSGHGDLVERIVAPALERIGFAWEKGDVALSQVYMASRICEEELDTLIPGNDRTVHDEPRMAIAVLEDHHRLGKRIVHSMLAASGFGLFDYDRVDADELIERVHTEGVEVLLVSTLMLRSALRVKYVRGALDERGIDVKIVVGGAPFRFDPRLWKEVGADATAGSASAAISIVSGILKGAP